MLGEALVREAAHVGCLERRSCVKLLTYACLERRNCVKLFTCACLERRKCVKLLTCACLERRKSVKLVTCACLERLRPAMEYCLITWTIIGLTQFKLILVR